MNKGIKKIIEGGFLSFIPLFCFFCFVYGAQSFLSSGAVAKSDENFLASVSDAPNVIQLQNNLGGDIEEVSDTGEKIQQEDDVAESKKEPELKSAISVNTDLSSEDEIIFDKSSDSKLPIASLTKLMTAIVSFDNYSMPEKIIVSESADAQPSMKTDLEKDSIFSVEELLNIMLIESSNKAAYALAENFGEENFVLAMNKKAQEIGMENTFFADPTGLSPDNVSTATDLVLLAKYILKNYPAVSEITTKQEYELDNFGKIKNTDQILFEMSNVALSKTGFTNYANGCLLLVLFNSQSNDYTINVVLGADDRFFEMRKLINLQK